MANFDPDLMAALDQVAPQQPQLPDDLMGALDQIAPPRLQAPSIPNLEGLKVPVQKSTGDELLHILSYLSYPLHAIAGGIEGGISEDPNETAVGGFVKGITGERKTRMKDVLGLDEGKPDDSWPEWLQKEALNFAVDIPFDPLTYVGTPAKAAGIVGKGLKAVGVPEGRSLISAGLRKYGGDYVAEKFAGSPLGSMLMRGLPGAKYEPIMEAEAAIARKASSVPAEELAIQTNKIVDDFFKANPELASKFTRADITQAIERPGSIPELQSTVEGIQPLRDLQTEWFQNVQKAKEKLDLPVTEAINEPGYEFMPQRLTPEGVEQSLRGEGLLARSQDAAKQAHREIYNWVDEAGNPILKSDGTPLIGKASDPRTGIVDLGKGEFRYVGPDNMKKGFVPDSSAPIVRPVQASLAEKMPITPERLWETDPVKALLGSTKDYQGKWKFLEMLSEYKNQGLIFHTNKAGENLQKGWRKVEIPGLGDNAWQAPKAVAVHLEQQAGKLWDKNTPMGTLPDLLDYAINKTLAGQTMKKGTTWFKRNVLGSPGWVSGNLGSNFIQQLAEMNPLQVAARTADAIKVTGGKGEPVIRGIENSALKNEFKIRDLYANQFSEKERNYLKGSDSGGNTEKLLNKIPYMPDLAAKGAQAVGTGIGKWNDAMFWVGGKAESNAKVTVAIDWLKKNAPDLATKSPEERATLLDRAATAAHKALINYSGNPFEERVLSNILPFSKWQLGITKRTAQIALDDPARLGRIDRGLRSITMPLSEDEKQKADAWVRESAPIKGIFGKSFDKWADDIGLPKLPRGERMMLLGRYLPQGFVEQLAARPMDALTSSINPFLKAPYEILANRNTFKDRPIDQLADTTGSMFTRPIAGGGPYSSATHQTFGQTLPAAYEYLLSVSPASRHMTELDMAGQAAGLWGDKYKAEAPSPAEFATWYATGGKTYPYDAAKYAKNRKREQRETEGRMKSQAKWAARNGDYAEVERINQQLYKYKAQRSRAFGSGEY